MPVPLRIYEIGQNPTERDDINDRAKSQNRGKKLVSRGSPLSGQNKLFLYFIFKVSTFDYIGNCVFSVLITHG